MFQISDWLTLSREMLKVQSIPVGDIDAIAISIDKQKVRVENKLLCFRWEESDIFLCKEKKRKTFSAVHGCLTFVIVFRRRNSWARQTLAISSLFHFEDTQENEVD